MIPRKLLALALLATFAAACGGGEPETDTAAATDDDEPAAAQENAVGRCAVDARDGAPYGRISAEETEEGTGEITYVISGNGAEWRKKASNVRVVDCE